MKSILYKVLLTLGGTIIIIITLTNYIFFNNNSTHIDAVRAYNLSIIIQSFDEIEKNSLKANSDNMLEATRNLSRYSSDYLKNFDIDGLRNILLFNLNNNNNILLISIWDNELNDMLLVGYKRDGKIVFGKKIPKISKSIWNNRLSKMLLVGYKRDGKKTPNTIHSATSDITTLREGKIEKLGIATLYYDNSIIHKKNELARQKIQKEISQFNNKMDVVIFDSFLEQLFISFIGLVSILFAMSILVKKIVNDPLNKLKLGLTNFFLLLQNKKRYIEKIDIHSQDEFGQMAKSLNSNISLSIKIHDEQIRLYDILQIKSSKEKVLLDNAGQGFLTFNKKFLIDEEYSKKCTQVLGFDIENKNISNILFPDEHKDAIKFRQMILDILDIKNKISQTSMISLLPSEIILNRRALRLEYKIVNNDKFMLIITNISLQRKLEKKIQEEQDILKMIITVMEDSDIFYGTKEDFEHFAIYKISYINKKEISLNNLNSIYRTIHTFKGIFLQLFMYDTAAQLHEVETKLSAFISNEKLLSNEDICDFLNEIDFTKFTFVDYEHIGKIIGKKFIESNDIALINKQSLRHIKYQAESLIEYYHINSKVSLELLNSIKSLLQKPLSQQLNSYPKLALRLAQELDKEIYEFQIQGDETLVVPINFKRFIQSLIHLIRNSIDHGIETVETRIELGKDPIGTISCNFSKYDDILQIIFSDDGAGIDVEKIKGKIPKEVDSSSLSDEAVSLYIFEEHISTKEQITDTSGRGIGMSVIKVELENLDGTVEIQSTMDIGTTFIFKIPLINNNAVPNAVIDIINEQTKQFISEDIGIKIINTQTSDDNLSNFKIKEYNSIINIDGPMHFTLFIGFEESILNHIANKLIGEEIGKESVIYNSTAGETINTIIGLSIPYFKNKGKGVIITTPIEISTTSDIKKYIDGEVNSLEITTEFGKLVLAIIKDKGNIC